MEFDPDLLYHRLLRYVALVFGFLSLCLAGFWLSEVRKITRTVDYHNIQVQSGRVLDRMRLSDKVWLYRTRHVVGMHNKDGGLIVPGVVVRIGYEDESRTAVLVAYRHGMLPQWYGYGRRRGGGAGGGGGIAGITVSVAISQLPNDWGMAMVRVELATGAVASVQNFRASREVLLPRVDAFYPERTLPAAAPAAPSESASLVAASALAVP